MRSLQLTTVMVCLTTFRISHSFQFPHHETSSEIGQSCVTPDGTVGICVLKEACQQAVRRWKSKGIPPKVCQFDGAQITSICCTRKSEEKCVDYNQPIQRLTVKLRKRRQSHNVTILTSVEPDIYYVVAGRITIPREFPYMAALGWRQSNTNEIYWRCGGTLISEQYVLTAAHCTLHSNLPPNVIKIGATDLHNTLDDSKPQTFNVSQIIVHPDYSFGSHYNDIALIRLNIPVFRSSDVNPICLQTTEQIGHRNVTIIGYGHTEFGGYPSDFLEKADLNISSNENCATSYSAHRLLKNGIVSSQICARDEVGDSDSCQGDSGGPLLVNEMGVKRIVGVTSFGQGCSSSVPGVYTRVSSYIDWIEAIVW